MEQLSNLDKLTEKIYQEGLGKADQRSKEIINEAEKQAAQIIKQAKAKAEEMINAAKKSIEKETRSAESEVKLKGKQLISDLKHEINYLLREKILDHNIKQSFDDQEFLKSLIIEIAGFWKSEEELELRLPSSIKDKLGAAMENGIAGYIGNLTITFNGRLSDGFRIARKSDSYVITFSEDDFIELFSTYLKDKTRTVLFTGGL